MDNLVILPIKEIINETAKVKTFCFSYNLQSKAGQFVMLWIPEVGQKPFSISYDDGNEFHLTVFQRGTLTNHLFNLNVGDNVGISGPYGTNFSIQPNTHYIMVAGGYGVAPLRYLAEQVVLCANTRIDFCLGAKDQTDLIFEKNLQKIPNLDMHIATENNSKGHHGYVTNILASLLDEPNRPKFKSRKQQKIMVATCGPELMEKTVLDFCNTYNLPCEISIERYIKCGVGVCGQCAVDDLGICLCQEGPVVSRQIANQITEFGCYARDGSGLKHFFKR